MIRTGRGEQRARAEGAGWSVLKYNNKERLARKIDLENHVKKLVRANVGPSSAGKRIQLLWNVRSSVTLGDSFDFVLLSDGIGVAAGALQTRQQRSDDAQAVAERHLPWRR